MRYKNESNTGKTCKQCGKLRGNHTYDEAKRCAEQELANNGQMAGTRRQRY